MPTRGLDEFVTKPMQTFFDQLEIEMEFLETGVALIHDYNRLMTKNEDQMQFLLQFLWSSTDDHSLIAEKERCYHEGRKENNNQWDKFYF